MGLKQWAAIGFIMLLGSFSCKTNNYLKRPISSSTNNQMVGLVVQFNQHADTSEVYHSLGEALNQCGWSITTDFFESQVYADEIFVKLYNSDTTFMKDQKSLNKIPQLLVAKLQFINKQDSQTGKSSVGLTCNARWISTSNWKVLHEFYYAEKINSPDNTIGLAQLQSFLGTQIYIKLCLDIQKFILKKN